MKARTEAFKDIYDSSSRESRTLRELKTAWRYKDFLIHLIFRDITTRYKRSVLGIAWTMLNPLGMMLVLSLIFSKVFHSIEAYPVYLFSGLIAWNFFSQTTLAALNMFLWGGSLMQKIYVPRASYAISSVGVGLVNLLISLVPLGVLALILDVPLRPSILFLPISILLLSLFALGIILIVATAGIIYRDVADMFQIVLMAWFYLSPVLYDKSMIDAKLQDFITVLNPMWTLVQLFRDPIYYGQIPPLKVLGIAAMWSFLIAGIGWTLFTRKANDLVYRL